ncbi:MAG: amino acid ABC transporter ATP-binding protein [Clostridia bacterium]|nr:amino acid ABC transporter ATP-binding protein [Clostridia bacterium]
MIELRHLRKAYEEATPLADVNAVIRDGDVISVIGPSGTGKSTLLRCINLLEMPTSGQILVNGTDITAKGFDPSAIRRRMGMVFQSFNLFGHRTVIENIMYAPVKLLHLTRQEAYDRGMELLRTVGLAEKALRYPDELSGGQKQRVAIARALAMDPEIILFDEPTSALDPTMVGEVQAVIRNLAQSGKTMMIVTHEMQFARSIANRVFYMDQGGIYEDGTPEEIYDHPQRERTRRFVQKLKALDLHIASRDFDFAGAFSEIDLYCYKSRIPPRIALSLQSVLEELCQQILLPQLAEPEISFSIEYSEKEETAAVFARYGGPSFDPENAEDRLALKVLKNRVSSMEHTYAPSDANGYTNCVRITL